MENMWNMSWYEEMLVVAFFLLVIFSLLLLVYALGVTAMSAMGNYSVQAVGLYWISLGAAFIIVMSGYFEAGALYYVCSSPVVAFAMLKIERQRKQN